MYHDKVPKIRLKVQDFSLSQVEGRPDLCDKNWGPENISLKHPILLSMKGYLL